MLNNLFKVKPKKLLKLSVIYWRHLFFHKKEMSKKEKKEKKHTNKQKTKIVKIEEEDLRIF